MVVAVKLEDLEKLKYLELKGADISKKTELGTNIMHYAAAAGTLDIIEYGIFKGIDFDTKDNGGYTPLLRATLEFNFEAAKFLIEKGANRRIPIPDKGMALDYYVIEGTSHSKEWIDLFLKH